MIRSCSNEYRCHLSATLMIQECFGHSGRCRQKSAQRVKLVAALVAFGGVRGDEHTPFLVEQVELILAEAVCVGTIEAVEGAAERAFQFFRPRLAAA